MIQARKNILNMFSIINSMVIMVSGLFVLQQLFSRPVTVPVPEPVVVVEIPKPAPPQIAPKPLEIERVEIKPKPTPLPPLPKVVPKPVPKPIEPVVVERPVEPVAPPKPPPAAKISMDNFNASSKQNSLGGFTGTFGGTGGFCLESYQKGSAFGAGEDGGGNILKLVYNVNNGYAGYYSKLNNVDLTKYHRVTFAVKGAKGGEVFEIELGDGSVSSKVDIRDYLPYGASTTWQKVSIPFKAFTEVRNWQKMKGNFAIVFEQYLGTPTNSTLYVDSINFEE
jgi:Carbohydrate binding domain (family 11)